MSQILTALTKIQTTRQGTTMSYERSLTFNLRVRGLSEVEITEVLDEVRAHETATGTAAEVEFGTAQEYAKQFPKQKRRTRGKTITTISTALAGAYVLLAVILMPVFRVDIRDFVGPVTLQSAAGLVLAGLLAGFLTDDFQPAQRSSAAGLSRPLGLGPGLLLDPPHHGGDTQA